jgi:hypothetical protein
MAPHNLGRSCSSGLKRKVKKESRLCLEKIEISLAVWGMAPHDLVAGR